MQGPLAVFHLSAKIWGRIGCRWHDLIKDSITILILILTISKPQRHVSTRCKITCGLGQEIRPGIFMSSKQWPHLVRSRRRDANDMDERVGQAAQPRQDRSWGIVEGRHEMHHHMGLCLHLAPAPVHASFMTRLTPNKAASVTFPL